MAAWFWSYDKFDITLTYCHSANMSVNVLETVETRNRLQALSSYWDVKEPYIASVALTILESCLSEKINAPIGKKVDVIRYEHDEQYQVIQLSFEHVANQKPTGKKLFMLADSAFPKLVEKMIIDCGFDVSFDQIFNLSVWLLEQYTRAIDENAEFGTAIIEDDIFNFFALDLPSPK